MKQTLKPGDVVLAYHGTFPVGFYHVTNIMPDIKRGFWHVGFMSIGMPSLAWSWLLEDDHLAGEEFTISGISTRLQLYSRPEKVVNQESLVIPEPYPESSDDSFL